MAKYWEPRLDTDQDWQNIEANGLWVENINDISFNKQTKRDSLNQINYLNERTIEHLHKHEYTHSPDTLPEDWLILLED